MTIAVRHPAEMGAALAAALAAAGQCVLWNPAGRSPETADTFAAKELPDGFHRAAAEVYRA